MCIYAVEKALNSSLTLIGVQIGHRKTATIIYTNGICDGRFSTT